MLLFRLTLEELLANKTHFNVDPSKLEGKLPKSVGVDDNNRRVIDGTYRT
jgi:hypothetical protein